MNLWQRLKNLKKLSEYEPGTAQDETKTPGTQVAMIIKKPEQKTIFIPRITRTPAQEITEEQP